MTFHRPLPPGDPPSVSNSSETQTFRSPILPPSDPGVKTYSPTSPLDLAFWAPSTLSPQDLESRLPQFPPLLDPEILMLAPNSPRTQVSQEDTHPPPPPQSRSHLAGAPAPLPQARTEHVLGDLAWICPMAESRLQDADVGTLQRERVLHCRERGHRGSAAVPISLSTLPPIS